MDVYLHKKDRTKLPSIKDLSLEQEKDVLVRMLKDYIEEAEMKDFSSLQIIEKYNDELKELCK
jgi:type I restriction enzyme M protein